jgi:outer membrane protein assembly factor BamE (lipoprotein component of BamABCDE complex)
MSKHNNPFHSQKLFQLSICMFCICILLASCKPQKLDYQYPPSNATCPTDFSWINLKPGESTQDDVIRVLGRPASTGKTKYASGETVPYFAYKVSGSISPYAQHRIYFDTNKKIYWIEVIVGDQDGQFHTVEETANLVGRELDTVYDNNNLDPFVQSQYDILAGPDTVLVWSECGLAILALPGVVREENGKLSKDPISKDSSNILKLRFPNVFSSEIPVSNLHAIVLLEYIFEPTTFENFMETYSYKIPFGLWTDYLRSLQDMILNK